MKIGKRHFLYNSICGIVVKASLRVEISAAQTLEGGWVWTVRVTVSVKAIRRWRLYEEMSTEEQNKSQQQLKSQKESVRSQ
jgi:hypothetical protein